MGLMNNCFLNNIRIRVISIKIPDVIPKPITLLLKMADSQNPIVNPKKNKMVKDKNERIISQMRIPPIVELLRMNFKLNSSIFNSTHS